MRKLALLPLLLLAMAVPAHGQETAPSSRYTELTDCEPYAAGDVETGEDWVINRCRGLDEIPVWLGFSDSARGYLGFGETVNLGGIFGLLRDALWPVEWRGVLHEDSFEPFAVIVRMVRPDAGQPDAGVGLLFVYRLRDDGTSCLIGADLHTNEAARAVADASQRDFACQSEPQVPELSPQQVIRKS